MTEERMQMIRDGLVSLEPTEVKIEDEGHLHVGHAGAKSGGHFKLFIVYKTLDALLKTEIHALSIKAKTPDEL